METKRKRRTKAEIEKSKGLGDTIEKITTATGIKAIVKFIAGEDCGCEERKQKLNELFPYKNAQCLTETEYNTLSEIFVNDKMPAQLVPSQQIKLIRIYNRVLHMNADISSCSSCWIDICNKLLKLKSAYENN
jgi:hypothetical protein